MSPFDSAATLYVRLRGRVKGPFSLDQLGRLREQGELTAFHEVSADGRHWQLASDAGLVAAPDSPRPDLQLTVEDSAAPPTQLDLTRQWFYLDATGAQQGAFSREQISQLGAQGAVNAATLVWAEGQPEWLPAQQTELAGLVPAAAPPQAAAGWAVNGIALIAGLLLIVLGLGCLALTIVEFLWRDTPSAPVVALLLAAGVFLGGTGLGVLAFGAFRRQG